MIKAVLFDFFGVLYPDTLWGLADVFIPDRSDEQKQALRDIVTRSDLGHIDRDTFWKEAAEVYGVSVEQAMEEKEKLGGANAQLLEVIQKLKDGGLKTAVISNVGVGFLDSAFAGRKAADYFDELVLSGKIGIIKPDRRIYEIAAERLGVELDECIFFDDAPHNVEGAKAAGMHAQHYDGIAACKAALAEHGVEV